MIQILDELIIAGEVQESSKKSVLRVVCWTLKRKWKHSSYATDHNHFMQVTQSDSVEEQESSDETLARLGSRSG